MSLFILSPTSVNMSNYFNITADIIKNCSFFSLMSAHAVQIHKILNLFKCL